MREITVSFVGKFSRNDPGALRNAKRVLDTLRSVWRNSAGNALPDRYATLHLATDAEIATVKRNVPVPIPCAKGCNHCCKFNEIYVTRHEAVLLVRHIASLGPEEREMIVKRILGSRSRSGGGNASPCVLLDPGGCSVYASRPLPCRGYHSLSEPACADRLNNNGPNPPTLAMARAVEFAALEVSNANKDAPYEVNALLRRIYSDPARLALWESGNATEELDLALGRR